MLVRLHLFQSPIKLQKRILRNLFRRTPFPDNPQRNREHHRLVLLDQLSKGAFFEGHSCGSTTYTQARSISNAKRKGFRDKS